MNGPPIMVLRSVPRHRLALVVAALVAVACVVSSSTHGRSEPTTGPVSSHPLPEAHRPHSSMVDYGCAATFDAAFPDRASLLRQLEHRLGT